MGRLINPDSAGKERTYLVKAVVLAVRELARQTEPSTESRDLAAYIALTLSSISATIDISVAAWEKRGYWVKADRFRMDWLWTGQLGEKMRSAVLSEDWESVALVSAKVGQKLNKVTLPVKHRLGHPWTDAWSALSKNSPASS